MTKILIFDHNFDFWPNFRFFTKILIFDQNFDFYQKMFDKNSFFYLFFVFSLIFQKLIFTKIIFLTVPHDLVYLAVIELVGRFRFHFRHE